MCKKRSGAQLETRPIKRVLQRPQREKGKKPKGGRDTSETELIELNRMARREKQRGRIHGALSSWKNHNAIHKQHNRRKQKIVSSCADIQICVRISENFRYIPPTRHGVPNYRRRCLC